MADKKKTNEDETVPRSETAGTTEDQQIDQGGQVITDPNATPGAEDAVDPEMISDNREGREPPHGN